MLAAGMTVCEGRYRLDEVVGRGGMAAVWRATDLQLERPVAIKVISDVLAGDERFVARFEREARLAAALNHPNLVKVFDFSIEEGRPFLVMEYVAGGTLLTARDRVDPPALARELLDALAHIHAAGILHRDVKPANVLIGADGSPRLTDFGIARSDDHTALTLTGQVMGTLRYIAPEVAEGRPATVQSDLYSVGVLLSEVAGEQPADALARLLARMTAADPDRRPRSAVDALAELEPTAAVRSETGSTGEATLQLPRSAAGGSGASGAARARAGVAGWIGRAPFTAASIAIVIVVALVALFSSGGSNNIDKEAARARTSTASRAVAVPAPAAADAPMAAQLDSLESIVRAAPSKR